MLLQLKFARQRETSEKRERENPRKKLCSHYIEQKQIVLMGIDKKKKESREREREKRNERAKSWIDRSMQNKEATVMSREK